MVDTLETARAFGLSVRPKVSKGAELATTIDFDPHNADNRPHHRGLAAAHLRRQFDQPQHGPLRPLSLHPVARRDREAHLHPRAHSRAGPRAPCRTAGSKPSSPGLRQNIGTTGAELTARDFRLVLGGAGQYNPAQQQDGRLSAPPTQGGWNESAREGFGPRTGRCIDLARPRRRIAGALPQQADPHPDPLRARRPDRRGGAALRRPPAQVARTEHPGREQARRLRHPRHRGNGPRQAGRLHHHGRQHLDQLPDAGAARQEDADQLRPRRADHRAAPPTRRCSSSRPRPTSRPRPSRSSSTTPRRTRCATPAPASAPISTSTPKFWPSAPAGFSSCTSRSRTAARASSKTWPAATPTCPGSTSPTRSA